jgi:transcriptional regulator with XRE-family HTH domain
VVVPPVGERIRAERLKRGISLRGLARDVGVSASLISQIETAKSQPSVSTLYAITSALGISIEDVFDAGSAADAGEAAADARLAAGPEPLGDRDALLSELGPLRGHLFGPLVRPAQRQVLKLDSGVTWERLGQLPGTHVDFLRVTYEPGGTSSSSGGLMRHSGSEYGFLISGKLLLTLGFEEIRLQPGDAICFESATPHSYRNKGNEPAVGVWFVIERGARD